MWSFKRIAGTSDNDGSFEYRKQHLHILICGGDSIFYFMPIFLAYTAGKKFGAKPFMSMVIACTMVYPTITTLYQSGDGADFLGIPVQLISYTSSVLPIILHAFSGKI